MERTELGCYTWEHERRKCRLEASGVHLEGLASYDISVERVDLGRNRVDGVIVPCFPILHVCR